MEQLLLEEIIMNILVRLPVKSLVRFKCVCKSWRSLINDPYFIRKHLNHVTSINSITENEHESQICTVENLFRYPNTTFYCMDIYKNKEEKECNNHQDDDANGNTNSPPFISELNLNVTPTIGSIAKLPITISVKELDFPEEFRCDDSFNSVEIKGCCDGMVCLVDSDGLLIWNPSIKECRRLSFPHPTTSSFLAYNGLRSVCFLDVFGIAYDPSIGDYKVLKIPSSDNNGEDYCPHSSTVEVLALKSNSWKTIQDDFPYSVYYHQLATFTNGGIHWLANSDSCPEEWLIVYFDVVGEKFGEVSLPHPHPHRGGSDTGGFGSLRLLAKELCVDWFVTGETLKLDLWVMKEYKVRESWTKLLTVSLSEGINTYIEPFCVMKKDTVIFYNKRVDGFIMYNASDQTLTRFSLGGFSTHTMKIAYQESLVSPISDYGFENATKLT